MKIHKVINIEQFVAKIIPKQAQKNKSIVESILKNVQKNGDSAVRKYEKKFTGASISTLRISKAEIKNAYSKVSKNELIALRLAKSRVEKTEVAVKSIFKDTKINHDGIQITKKFIPIQSTGCYIPGGLAKYPSSVIMSVIPATPKLNSAHKKSIFFLIKTLWQEKTLLVLSTHQEPKEIPRV